mmetsp:Transcript_65842/g.109435  ORF Transcript_65842/g.109435 Transcript_65842/m.109435 type:complete len:600 (+) Transcript_65842:85-1884(+)|eukprot:CAMPEP_0119304410 /NCGR_PEP_ID=MMETSP1333-20130426/5639_1 /TAXON_ID=418940 /ORGANISM="Scyphosphaera apsteinii, Strain RCC1455" /LENGTH=599 /DNA_ID=CAMNT_0007307289 /DNA_START=94 /DNA_END=1893 /DNA_ORIENTATION=-
MKPCHEMLAGFKSAPSRLQAAILLIAACVQNGICSGLLFGFAALQPSLHLLDGMTDDYISRTFTLAAAASMLAPLLLAGPLLDMCGPRVCSCVCTLLVATGFLLFGTSPVLPGSSIEYFLPSIVLIGVGGPGCQCCLFHIANLFAARGTALNLITASIGTSFVMFEVLVWLSKLRELSLQDVFLLYSILPFACTAISALISSDTPFVGCSANGSQPTASEPPPLIVDFPAGSLPEVSTHAVSQHGRWVRAISLGAARPMVFILRKKTLPRLSLHGRSQPLGQPLLGTAPGDDGAEISKRFPPYHRELKRLEAEQGDVDNLLGAPLLKQLSSATFVELTLVFATFALFYNIFLGSMREQAQAVLLQHHPNSTKVTALSAKYVSTYLASSPLGALFSPPLGHLIDQHGFNPMLLFTLFCGAAHALTLWAGSFFLGAVLFSLLTAACFSYMYSFLAFNFGFTYYGLLAGIIQLFASLVTLVMQPAFCSAAKHVGWQCMHLVQVAAFATLGLYIVSTRFFRHKQRQRQRQRAHPVASDAPDAAETYCSSGRSYSDGDLHVTPGEPFRRRPNLFPNADDILVVDGAHTDHSRAAYLLDNPVIAP